MPVKLDLMGMRFGRLFVTGEAESTKDKRGFPITRWNVKCDCGKEKSVRTNALRIGDTVSCGCLHSEISAQMGRDCATHAMSKTPEYHTWCAIKDRCYNPKVDPYQYYGAKGITVCSEWLKSFESFFSVMGMRPSKNHSIERLDNSKGYEPGNCVWATAKAQRLNQENRVIWVVVKGIRKCMKDAAIEAGVLPATAYRRFHVGWTIEECLRPV